MIQVHRDRKDFTEIRRERYAYLSVNLCEISVNLCVSLCLSVTLCEPKSLPGFAPALLGIELAEAHCQVERFVGRHIGHRRPQFATAPNAFQYRRGA